MFYDWFKMCWENGTATEQQMYMAVEFGYITEEERREIMGEVENDPIQEVNPIEEQPPTVDQPIDETAPNMEQPLAQINDSEAE